MEVAFRKHSTMKFSYRRYSGAGNEFVVIDAIHAPNSLTQAQLSRLAIQACSPRMGQGADGLILIRPSAVAPFTMEFFNPDGSFGALCGNGARCAVQAANDFGITHGGSTTFEVLGAINSAELLRDEYVRVHFQDPNRFKLNFQIRVARKDFVTTSYVDLGSQHAVTFMDALSKLQPDPIETLNIRYWGPMIRWQPDFAPKGVNANFAEMRMDEAGEFVRIRTFERGVEGETLACGTGCMSTAIVAIAGGRATKLPIRLLTESGEFVQVNFRLEGDRISDLTLEGSANRGSAGVLDFEA